MRDSRAQAHRKLYLKLKNIRSNKTMSLNNNLSQYFRKSLGPLIKFIMTVFFGEIITNKPLPKTVFNLYYPVAKHLIFLFKSSAFYEEDIKKIILDEKLIKQNNIVFDIGANIGQYMLFFADAVGPNGRVVSFEPNPDAFKFLSLNKVLNEIPHVTLCKSAVGEEEGIINLGIDNGTGGRSSSTIDSANFETFEIVEQTTLASAVSRFGVPDFVKIDIEGAEENIFFNRSIIGGLEKTIFIIEVRKESKEGIFSTFANYRCFCVETDRDIQCASEIPDFANLFFFPLS